MRKLIYAINITLDGNCDHTKAIADEELHDYHTQILRGVDTFVYGRKTFELMVPFWPDVAKNPAGQTRSTREFAEVFDSVRKIVVFSKSLTKADERTKIVRSNLRDEILKLKQEDGKDIATGGVDIPSQLIQLGLVDEYHFVVQPSIGGDESRLLKGINFKEALQLKLLESKVFKSGCVALRYSKT